MTRNLTLCKKCVNFHKHVLKPPEGVAGEEIILYHCDKGTEDEKLLGFEKVKVWQDQLVPEDCTMTLEFVTFTGQKGD